MNYKSIHTPMTLDSFWRSIHILLTKPHVVNKRVWGSKIWFKCNSKPNNPGWNLPVACYNLEDIVTDENVETLVAALFKNLNICVSNEQSGLEVMLIELIPKAYTDKAEYQLVFLKKDENMVTFYNVTPMHSKQNLFKLCPDFSYTIQLDSNNIVLSTFYDGESKSYMWLVNTLLPQLIKWGIESTNKKMVPNLCTESLTLVSKTKYYEKYNNLKLKYGRDIVKTWPECTDASKFVYEDIAIATYILLLWEQDSSQKKKTFLDLGCGNGLLVYILTKEGHNGKGIDVRKRNIWDMYSPEIILQEKTITPSDISLFPDVDCVIGNHSDELTPWIPVIAARSSFKCNFFLLPCCAFNFDGSKYQRKNSYNSQYIDYLEYIVKLCKDCGFIVIVDRLKIPSTKRTCIISTGRSYSEGEHQQYCIKIDDLLHYNSNVGQVFKAREAIERVKNCTRLDKNIINAIVTCITNYLLEDCHKSDTDWSVGKSVAINDLIQLIPQDQLNELKNECGGLQTLLKNNHHIFNVHGGRVELRYPKTIYEVTSTAKKRKSNQTTVKIKQKPCWFHSNHPQGCPLNDKDCSFLHIKS